MEIDIACERERHENRVVLFPVRVDHAVMDNTEPWAAGLRRPDRIVDFTGWDDQGSYQKAFDRLVRDLKAQLNPKSDSQAAT